MKITSRGWAKGPSGVLRATSPFRLSVLPVFCLLCCAFLLVWQFSDGSEPENSEPLFNHNKVVVIIAFDRYVYFQSVVDALLSAKGSHDYTVVICIDGPKKGSSFNAQGRASIIKLSAELELLTQKYKKPFKQVLVHASSTNSGIWQHKKSAVAQGFALSDFIIVLEDDVVLAPDALQWFEWHVTSGYIFKNPSIRLATCWSAAFPYNPQSLQWYDIVSVYTLGLLDKYVHNMWATPWGWAIWRNTWDGVKDNWTGQDVDLTRLMQEKHWYETQPVVPRCNNIGMTGQNSMGQTGSLAPHDHIHRRQITSAIFPNIHKCRYTYWRRQNETLQPQHDTAYKGLRAGIGPGYVGAPRSMNISEYVVEIEKKIQRRGQFASSINIDFDKSSC